MDELEAHLHASAADRDLHRPLFFRPADPNDRERLQKLLSTTPGIRVFDELHGQLRELVRALDPTTTFTSDELDAAARAHLRNTEPERYGVWVFYPWSGRLVHVLDEQEFALVRTDRNRNKITREEQEVISRARIGVVGLSVGQSVALTMALERGFGEIRLADMDILELSNMNRIRSGLHNLGLRKTVNVAREIAEIDPYLKITLFDQGLTPANIDEFLTGGGKLDIAVDECDSVDIEDLLRQRAKAMQIAVVMDTSDRGMLDVERFDLEPERPILHGLIDHLDLSAAAKAKTNEEKLPFVLPIAGVDTLSKRMKASMLEIGQSVTTWPQLATSVVLGGAIAGDVCRRILLGQSTVSGRWFVDMDELVAPGGSEHARDRQNAPRIAAELTLDDMLVSAERLGEDAPPSSFTNAQITALVAAGCAAPTGGNSQPWQFLVHEGRLLLFLDRRRAHASIDPALVYARLGLGACIENVVLKAAELGLKVDARTLPLSEENDLIASFTLLDGAAAPDPLSRMIGLRCTNRRKADGRPIAETDLDALKTVVRSAVPEADVAFTTDPGRIAEIGVLCGMADRVRMLHPVSHDDLFKREMRWNQEEVSNTNDGIDIATMELSLSDRTGISVAADPDAVAHLRQWGKGRGFERLSQRLIAASPAVVLFSVPPALTMQHALLCGRAVQRLWLKAAEMNIAVHPISGPIFMGLHERFDQHGLYSPSERSELATIFQRLLAIFPHGRMQPLFMMRLSHADPPTARSLRRPVADVLHFHQPVAS